MKELELNIETSKQPSIDIPSEGIQMPDVEVGEQFPLPATFVKKDDKTICLVEVGGKEMPGYEDKDENDPEQPPIGQDDKQGLVKMDDIMKNKFNSYGE